MKKWFSNLGYKLSGFMQGRYGYDELSRFLAIAGMILMLMACIPYLSFLYAFGFAMFIGSWFRTMSRNIYKRQMERSKYLIIKNGLVQKFRLFRNMRRERKTHKYYKCPSCKAYARITHPGKGKRVMVTCPKCGQSFEKRT